MTDRPTFAYGDLNAIELEKIGRSVDFRNTTIIDVLKETVLATYKKDALENIGPLKGVVLRVDNNPNEQEPDSWMARIFGAAKVATLKSLKVRIPEIHASLPEPGKYGANAGESNKVIDMYPSFLSISEEVSNKPVAPGDIVLVDFGNRANLSQPIYLGPVLTSPTPGAVGQKTAQNVFNNTPGGLQVELPKGDSFGVKDKNNQLPRSSDGGKKSMIPENNAGTVNGLPDPPPEFKPITIPMLKKIMPKATDENITKYLDSLNKSMALFEINTPQRQAAFLSQIAVESGQLKYDTELSSGTQYEGRKNLGNTQPGDGARFKGRGLIQLTGRANYAIMTKKVQDQGLDVNFIDNPELVSRPDISTLIAGQYFKDHHINAMADKGDIVAVSRSVNGGNAGLDHRIAFYNTGLKVITEENS